MFVWIASIVAGTANDAIFMALPMVDNFWQVQRTSLPAVCARNHGLHKQRYQTAIYGSAGLKVDNS